jgi:hypothetical protein
MLIEGFLTERVFMNDVLLFGGILVGVTALLATALAYAVYGGVHGTLASAKPGEIYNFIYKQPLQGEPERYLAKVVEVHTLDDYSIRRLNARSRYRANDPEFQRTRHLVTCEMPNGTVRNFYAERTEKCRRPVGAQALFATGLAHLI